MQKRNSSILSMLALAAFSSPSITPVRPRQATDAKSNRLGGYSGAKLARKAAKRSIGLAVIK